MPLLVDVSVNNLISKDHRMFFTGLMSIVKNFVRWIIRLRCDNLVIVMTNTLVKYIAVV